MTEKEISDEIIRRTGLPFKDRNSYNIKCFEHNDNHPSMTLTKSIGGTGPGFLKCWVCGYSKTLKSYYYEKTGHSILRDLKKENGNIIIHKQYYVRDEVNFEMPPKVNFKFEGSLIPLYGNEKGLNWLKSRGFTSADADEYGMKYAIFGVTKKIDDLKNKDEYTYFTDRAIISIYENGKLLCVEGRDINGKDAWLKNTETKDIPYRKVLYPKHGSTNTLFRVDKLDTKKPLFLVEGIMDVVSLRKHRSFHNTTSMFKCLPSERQLYLLSRFPEVILIPNNDVAAYNGAKKIWESLPTRTKILPVPKQVNDVNDILQGKHPRIKTIDQLVNLKWLNNIVGPSEQFFDARLCLLQH